MVNEAEENRRPVQARSSRLAQRIAARIAATNITPNQISVASVLCAAGGAACLLAPKSLALLVAAVAIQARLLCNLFDGMVAMEGGKKSPLGALYNEFPDRLADSLLIIALGYAAGAPALGWFGALAAALTAYVRVFGGSLGLLQDFRGPMAKQHRMAVMTAGCIAGEVERFVTGSPEYSLLAASFLIAVGSVVTCVTRTWALAARLKGD